MATHPEDILGKDERWTSREMKGEQQGVAARLAGKTNMSVSVP